MMLCFVHKLSRLSPSLSIKGTWHDKRWCITYNKSIATLQITKRCCDLCYPCTLCSELTGTPLRQKRRAFFCIVTVLASSRLLSSQVLLRTLWTEFEFVALSGVRDNEREFGIVRHDFNQDISRTPSATSSVLSCRALFSSIPAQVRCHFWSEPYKVLNY